MTINGKKILEKLEAAKKVDRQKVTLYLSKSLYSEFKVKCSAIPMSLVLEELLREFIASTSDPKTKSKK